MLDKCGKAKLAVSLGTHLIERDIREGFPLLDRIFSEGLELSPEFSEDFGLLLCLAQWVDLGYRNVAFLEGQLAPFEEADLLGLSLLEFTQLRLCTAFSLMVKRELPTALQLLQGILQAYGTSLPQPVRFVAHFWKGRAHRQAGEFDQAFAEIRAAKECARQIGADKLVAVAEIHESWLLFHQGERRVAFQLLDEAETVLRPTGHALSLGNIEAARGRFVRASGDYRGALGHFEAAIRIYGEHYPEHPNLARALVNAAYIKRLMALDLQPRLRGEPASAKTHAHSLRIAREAMDLLRRAETIYAKHQHQAGSGSVLVNLGHLQLESGEIEEASDQAQSAYNLGREKADAVLMARARILQAYVQVAWAEEQIESPPGAAPPPAQLAVEYAEEAITLAQGTENTRLLAGAYITRGLVAVDDYHADRETARKYAAKAAELLRDETHDHLFRELSSLKLRITSSTALNDTLRHWADGELDGKSFQQIEEEFAEIVIPRVWQKLGRNVSLVAQQLSISPKKVRRVLRNSHHVAHSGGAAE